jgi:hypothetical protein
MANGWKKGPLPKKTWGFGGVVTLKMTDAKSILSGKHNRGFQFADFHGDHVFIVNGKERTRVEADEVAFYNNDIQVPICVTQKEPELCHAS